MEHRAGHIYSDASLPALLPSQRGAAYAAMSRVLAKIHSVDLGAARLQDYGERGERRLCVPVTVFSSWVAAFQGTGPSTGLGRDLENAKVCRRVPASPGLLEGVWKAALNSPGLCFLFVAPRASCHQQELQKLKE